ncbi:hypothetical protein F5X99DRAFT_397248, partial [Biscogniauxia marginata]
MPAQPTYPPPQTTERSSLLSVFHPHTTAETYQQHLISCSICPYLPLITIITPIDIKKTTNQHQLVRPSTHSEGTVEVSLTKKISKKWRSNDTNLRYGFFFFFFFNIIYIQRARGSGEI